MSPLPNVQRLLRPRIPSLCDHAIHPSGPEQNPCLGFAEVTEHWEPLGAGYYDGDLVLQSEHYLSTEERLDILNTHPLFTGICPKCGAKVEPEQRVHYDC
jgi:hypothetical protein